MLLMKHGMFQTHVVQESAKELLFRIGGARTQVFHH